MFVELRVKVLTSENRGISQQVCFDKHGTEVLSECVFDQLGTQHPGLSYVYKMRCVCVHYLPCVCLHSGFYVQPDVVVFTVDPSDTVTCLGCEVELTCGVRLRETGAQLPQPEMTWERNGTQLDGTEPGVTITFAELDGVDSVYFNLSYLRIVGIGLEHAGAYR